MDQKETTEVIWGKLAGDDLSGARKATLYTMNDIDLCYHKDLGKYSVSIETIYDFDTAVDKAAYLQGLLKSFTGWMDEQGYDTDRRPSLQQAFGPHEGYFDTIEEVYADFRCRVLGYCQMI